MPYHRGTASLKRACRQAAQVNLAGYVQVTCENVAGNRQVMWLTVILYTLLL